MHICSGILPRTIRIALFWYGFEHMSSSVFQSAKFNFGTTRIVNVRNHHSTIITRMSDLSNRKDVVTSFVRRQTSSGWEYVLVQRSHDVSTYQYPYWGAVSGGVEKVDVCMRDRALIEIEEEVGYTQDDVEFVRAGRPLYVDDNGRHFKVHPYLFTLLHPDKPVKLNWENVDARFCTERALSELQPKVPLLQETLDTLLMSAEQLRRYEIVQGDRAHGAAELCVIALDQFCEDALSRQASTVDELVRHVQNFGHHLATCRPNMSPVGNSIVSVLRTWVSENKKVYNLDVEGARGMLEKLVEKEKQQIAGIHARVVSEAVSYLGSRAQNGKETMSIVTLSLSSSIRDSLIHLMRQNPSVIFNVLVCESRPLFEGVKLGVDLLGCPNARIHLVTDAQMNSVFVNHTIDVVVVGADSLSKRSFVNKVGTMPLALVAHHYSVDVIVVADVSKSTTLDTFVPEEKHIEEVTQAWVDAEIIQAGAVDQFSASNTYFEEIPLDLVTCIISSGGKISPEHIGTYIEDLSESYSIAFR